MRRERARLSCTSLGQDGAQVSIGGAAHRFITFIHRMYKR